MSELMCRPLLVAILLALGLTPVALAKDTTNVNIMKLSSLMDALHECRNADSPIVRQLCRSMINSNLAPASLNNNSLAPEASPTAAATEARLNSMIRGTRSTNPIISDLRGEQYFRQAANMFSPRLTSNSMADMIDTMAMGNDGPSWASARFTDDMGLGGANQWQPMRGKRAGPLRNVF